MKKIGIYLQAGPSCGGTYQYNGLMLDALMLLPKDQYTIVAFYGAKHWRELVNAKNITSRYIKVNLFYRWILGLWRRLKLPLTWWHQIATICHPLARAMVKENCDLWIFPSQDAYAYWMPVHSIATIHDLMHRYERSFPEVGANKEYKNREFHYQNICRFAKGILVDSELGKNQVIESYGVSSEKCLVLPYVAPKSIEKIFSFNFNKKYSLPEKYLFYPAQFWEHKNHANLLRAMAKSRADIPDLQLVLVGSKKNAYQKTLQLIAELKLKDCVHLLGLVDDFSIPELYRRARALVMPTFFGPTNIPPLEAFALGCPVAISGIYAMKEQLQDAALFFQPDSVEDMAAKIKMIWQDDEVCRILKEKGKRKHQEWNHHGFTERVHQIIKLLSQ